MLKDVHFELEPAGNITDTRSEMISFGPDGMELWKPEVYRNGDVSYKKEDGKEVYAKNASLSVTKETSRIGCPQPPKQIDPNRADSDLTQ